MADVKVSGLPSDSSLDGNHYTIINDPTGPTTKRTLLSTLAAFFFNQVNIPDGSGSPRTRMLETMLDFVQTGIVWSGDAYASTRVASMTAGVVYINGRRLTINAVVSRTFTASRDTYIDILDNGDGTATIVYTEATNNNASPALAANSIRVGIIVTGASNIAAVGSINQGEEYKVLPIASSVPYQVTDSLGNMICCRDPNRKLLGHRQRISTFSVTGTTAVTQIPELSVPVKVPTGRKVMIELSAGGLYNSSASVNANATIWRGAVVSGTQVGYCYGMQGGSSSTGCLARGLETPASASNTYNGGLTTGNSGTTASIESASATTPVRLDVWLI